MSQKNMNRRKFLGSTAMGLMTAGLGLPRLTASSVEKSGGNKIIYRTLGRTGLKISAVSFGVMNSDSPDLINRALDMGVNHLDTAHVYLRGKSEQVIGEVVERRGDRDKIIIGTKMRFNRDRKTHRFLMNGTGRQPAATPENLYEQLELSLERLRTDYIDILYLHSCYSPEMVTFEPLKNALVKVKKQGKTRFIGISTHSNEPDVIRAAVDTGVYDVILTSYNFVQKHRKEVKKAIQYAVDKGIGIVAMKTQGGGRFQRESKVGINHTAALKWVLQDENVCTSIPGMTSFDQLDLNFKTMNDLAISSQEKADIIAAQAMNGILYCQNCRSCIPTCPKSVEIPHLIRAYMYADGYGNPYQARNTIAELPDKEGLDVCRSCTSCTAVCANGIDISARVDFLIKSKYYLG